MTASLQHTLHLVPQRLLHLKEVKLLLFKPSRITV